MTRESGKRTRLRFGAVSAEVSLVKASTKPREAQHETRRVLVDTARTDRLHELAESTDPDVAARAAADLATDPFGDPVPAPERAPVTDAEAEILRGAADAAVAPLPSGLLGPMGDPSWPPLDERLSDPIDGPFDPTEYVEPPAPDDLAEQAAEAPPPRRQPVAAPDPEPDAAGGPGSRVERQAAETYTPPATRVEQGVHLEDGTWVDLTARLAEVDERTKVDGLEVVRTIPASSYASERVRECHYLAGVEPQTYKVLGLLWRALRATGRAAEVRWTKRTAQTLGLILARGEFGSKSNPAHLALLELEWAQNVRAPSGRATGPITAAATREEVDAAVELVESFHAPAPREELVDERLAKRAELLTLARAGELEAYAPPAEPMPEDLGAEVDVAEALALAAAWNREHAPGMTAPLPDRIRAGEVDPWAGAGADGARRSAQIADDELATLAQDDPRRPELEDQRAAWAELAQDLEARAAG